MRKVVEKSMVAHLWANKSQDEARTAGNGSFYFHGSTIWSFGRHFAIAQHLDNGRILWNDAGYSNTTAKHKHEVWRALSQRQRDSEICVPGLDESKIENLRRYKTGVHTQGLPTVVENCRNAVIELVQGIAKFRSIDKMNSNLFTARKYEASAHTLLDYVKPAKGKNTIGKWPLPALPDSVPADKAERLAFIASYAKARLMESYSVNLADHKSTMARIVEMMAEPMGYQDQNLISSLQRASVYLNEACKAYKTANADKTFSGYKALQAKVDALRAPVEARVNAFNFKAAQHALDSAMRDCFKDLRTFKIKGRTFSLSTGKTLRRPFSMWRIDNALETLGDKHNYANEIARMRRIEAFHDSAKSFDDLKGKIESAETYMPKFKQDALRMYKDVQNILKTRITSESFKRLHADLLSFYAADIDGKIQSIRAELHAEHAAKLGQWMAGENVHIGYEVGTFARIKGDRVETSRGAHVPIEHACRLAKIARRVIANGGKTWTNNDGPMVGGFRVISIGADGATVIGCHDFDAPEALRMLDLLDNCAACCNVVETV